MVLDSTSRHPRYQCKRCNFH